ncbi:MAG: 50S ribosomal protein L6 [Patescibacteria group bacterium]|jgi:large subunit ribosomal protein L6
MSRLGKLPIKLGPNVQATVGPKEMTFQGPKGKFCLNLHPAVVVKVENGEIIVAPRDKDAQNSSALWGLMWSLIKNAAEGVSTGFVKKLEINGVGYRAAVSGNQLNMSLGFSHPIEFVLPVGITATVAANVITLEGIDKALVGETAAQIRRIRRPEPYKGKGVKYADEIIRRKAGKAAAKGK